MKRSHWWISTPRLCVIKRQQTDPSRSLVNIMYEPEILTNVLLVQYPLLLRSIAELHYACVERDVLFTHFEEPFDVSKVQSYWTFAMLEPGREIIFIHGRTKGEVAAVVMLNKPFINTGLANATVANLLVHRDYRRLGMSKDLMRKVEEVARAAGKTLIVCFYSPVTTLHVGANLHGSTSTLRWDRKPSSCFGSSGIPRSVQGLKVRLRQLDADRL